MSVFTNPASASKESAAAYTAAILDLLGERDPLEVLRATPGALNRVLDGVPESAHGQPERPGKWSMRQVLRHLADSDIVWAWRMRLALAQERPPITGYDQDAWAERLGYGDADARDSLDDFEALRRSNLRLLERATPADMARVGVHEERGEESVAHMMRMYAGHDLLHIRQLHRIREAVAGGAP